MAMIQEVIEGLTLLKEHGATDVEGQHDVIFAGPDLTTELTEEEKARLDELGWHFDEETDSWAKFT